MKILSPTRRPHPSMNYARAYETSIGLFGLEVPPEFLISRIRSYSWEQSFSLLAQLSAKVNRHGSDSEEIRHLTVDPLVTLSGDASAASIIRNVRRAVETRRDQITIAHEQALSFIEHLVILEGGDATAIPADSEISLWLGCAGAFLSRWQQDSLASSTTDDLIATLSHAYRFNNSPDAVRNLVRSALLFARPPSVGELADQGTWASTVNDAFGGCYEEFFDSVLGPLYLLSQGWGDGSSIWSNPVIDVKTFFAETRVPADKCRDMLDLISWDRETLRDDIRKRLKDGLPHAPTALTYRPFVRMTANIYVAASPWAVQHQLRFAPWERLRHAAKTPLTWFRAFGQLVESWCRDIALEAQRSTFFRAHLHMPQVPGGDDEIEDVVLMEGRAVILFSVKSRVMRADASREAVSVATTMQGYRDYFFDKKGDVFRSGAIRQLDGRVRMIRDGCFENQGIPRNSRILPVIVTYDSLGESDQLYRWLESECAALGLLQGVDIGPVTLADVDDFED